MSEESMTAHEQAENLIHNLTDDDTESIMKMISVLKKQGRSPRSIKRSVEKKLREIRISLIQRYDKGEEK
jgi:hypothetical protein